MTGSAPELVQALVAQLKERLYQARWYRRNACAVHGVHFDDDVLGETVTVHHQHTHEHQSPPVKPAPVVEKPVVEKPIEPAKPVVEKPIEPVEPVQPVQPTTPAPPDPSDDRSHLWKLLLWAGLTGLGVGLPIGAYVLNRGGESTSTTTTVPGSNVGSLLQDLEDRGYHVPLSE